MQDILEDVHVQIWSVANVAVTGANLKSFRDAANTISAKALIADHKALH